MSTSRLATQIAAERLWGTEEAAVEVIAGAIATGSTGTQPRSDAGPAWTTSRGVSGARVTSADASGGVISVTDAPTTGQKIVISDIELSVDTTMRVDFKEETTGTVINSIYMVANSSVNLVTRGKKKLVTANKKLQVITSVAGNISVNVLYYSEA